MKVGGRLEARVELYDKLLVDILGHLVPGGEADDGRLEGLGVHREPAGNIADAVLFEATGGELARRGRVLDLDFFARLHVVAGDVDLVAVNTDVSVVHELAGGGPA